MDHLGSIENMHEDSRNSLLKENSKSDPPTSHNGNCIVEPLITSAFSVCFPSASTSFVLRIGASWNFFSALKESTSCLV